MKSGIKQVGSWLWSVASRNVVLKICSFLFAIMLWSYVVSSDTSITRTKTVSDLTGYISGQATLEVYGLALLDDPTSALSDISVQLKVPQATYSMASSESVQVMLDVSSVRTAGQQQVPLKATSAYGSVVSIYPESLTLTFETLDSRSIPVNVVIDGGKSDEYWYNTMRVNPQQITVSGATSLVQSISSAKVTLDVSEKTSSFTSAHTYSLLNTSGEETSQSLLNRSASSITVAMEIFPTKELKISTAVEDVLSGQVADGYEIGLITCQPESITVAAEHDLLNAIDKLVIEPVEIDNSTQSFTKRASISGLSDFKYISSEQVYVTVQITEETVSDWIDDVYLTFIGKGDGLTLSWQRDTIAVRVTGPRSQVEDLIENGLTATVDITGYGVGKYEVPINIYGESYPDVEFEMETDKVQITLDETAGD